MAPESDFDIDFADGKAGEDLVEALLTKGRTIEVKTDRRWSDTGNLYIETECFFRTTNAWGPSGLNVTKADYWAFVLEGTVVMVPTGILLWAVNKYGRRIDSNSGANPSKGYLITVDDLMRATREAQ